MKLLAFLLSTWQRIPWNFDRWFSSELDRRGKATVERPRRASVRWRRQRFRSESGRKRRAVTQRSAVPGMANFCATLAKRCLRRSSLDFPALPGISWTVDGERRRWWSSVAAGKTSADEIRTNNSAFPGRTRPWRKFPTRSSNRHICQRLRETTTVQSPCKKARRERRRRFGRCWRRRGTFGWSCASKATRFVGDEFYWLWRKLMKFKAKTQFCQLTFDQQLPSLECRQRQQAQHKSHAKCNLKHGCDVAHENEPRHEVKLIPAAVEREGLNLVENSSVCIADDQFHLVFPVCKLCRVPWHSEEILRFLFAVFPLPIVDAKLALRDVRGGESDESDVSRVDLQIYVFLERIVEENIFWIGDDGDWPRPKFNVSERKQSVVKNADAIASILHEVTEFQLEKTFRLQRVHSERETAECVQMSSDENRRFVKFPDELSDVIEARRSHDGRCWVMREPNCVICRWILQQFLNTFQLIAGDHSDEIVRTFCSRLDGSVEGKKIIRHSINFLLMQIWTLVILSLNRKISEQIGFAVVEKVDVKVVMIPSNVEPLCLVENFRVDERRLISPPFLFVLLRAEYWVFGIG